MGKGFTNSNISMIKSRMQNIYKTPGDTRDEFFRDYTRILHSYAYRRLKHKTQVFFNINNDHICTRMEHVSHVEAVSHSIALGLGLDTELTRAIAIGHDLGHAPFGHQGECVLDNILINYLSDEYKEKFYNGCGEKLFWHEKNGLRFVDNIELLADPCGKKRNLNLTYAVRDGIVSHCGEIDENGISPRSECFNLQEYKTPGQYSPCSWEGCVVKVADKIAYLGRDIEDAITLNILSEEEKIKLMKLGEEYGDGETLNTSSSMHGMIGDICENSTPEKGIRLGDKKYELLCAIKKFNYDYIYKSEQLNIYKDYVDLMLNSIFKKLYSAYQKEYTIRCLQNEYLQMYPKLSKYFIDWLVTYCTRDMIKKNDKSLIEKTANLENDKIYGKLDSRDLYVQAIVDFISGMTDSYAISVFEELISF